MEGIVLSWTIEDISNQNLYTDEVKNIPDEFHSLGEYLDSYTIPLIEETRAEFLSCLETIAEAPSARIENVALDDANHDLDCNMDILANEFSGGADMYEPKNGDVLILSSLKPEYINDFFRYGITYCIAIVNRVSFAIVKEVSESQLDEVLVDRFTMSVSPTTTSDQIQRCTWALYMTNIVTNSRILKALQYSGVDQNFTLLTKVLSRNQMVSRNQMESSICGNTHEQNNPETTSILGQLRSIDLNQSQLEAVRSTISAVQCSKSSIELVWGPPGTGKTKTVGLILWLLKQLKIRTLTCAPTNVAVLGVCSQLVHLLKNLDQKNGDSDGQPLSMADIVLFGNRKRMDIVGDLEDVFLDSRINHLMSCFLSETNWRWGVTSMIGLLDVCISMYDSYVKKMEESQELCLCFGDYFRGQFKELGKTLNSCFRTLFVHLPRRFLSSVSCMSIVSLQGVLRELGDTLSSSDLTDEQLRQTFETPPVSISAQKKLIESCEECVKHLRNLLETLTLTLPPLTDDISIKNFCLQNATLVFCTAASSFLLHRAQTSCFNVVVIDEAAQLKECESVIPLRLNHVKHALLVGDECQLPALVHSRASKTAGFGKSLFERLVSLQHEKHLLNIQYRMHPSISLFPNNRFYDGKILDGPNVLVDGYNEQYMHFIFGSYAFVNIGDGREEHDEVGKSWRNRVEVAVIVHLVASLYKSWERTNGKLTIGIISPYTAQVRTIKDKIGKKYDNNTGFEVRVKSIDGFQGQEDDIIILSMVRCNTEGNVGFLYDNQRTNVAITRARHCLWIVGNAATLSNSGTAWSDIVFDAKQRGHLFDAKDVEDLAKVILNIKNELDQLADLMDPNSVLFSSTRWKVVFSNEFVRSFARLKSKHARMGLIQMLLRLAGGWRSKRRNLNMVDCSCPLTRVYQVAELCLVWSIDLQNDQEKKVYTQIIKLWNLVPLAEVEGLLKRMDYIFSMYTDAYMERCKTICIEGTIEVPMMWTDEIAQYRKNDQHEITGEDLNLSDSNSSFLEDSKVSESLVLMRFYALSSGVVKHLLMARDGSEVDIPFELNDQEMEIIQFPNSSFILGRSGTGKTTVLTTKLVRMEQQFFVASHGMGSSDGKRSGVVEGDHENEQLSGNMAEVFFIKQVFLTVSPKLCSAIRDQVNRLVRYANFGELSGPIDSVTMHDAMDKLDAFTDVPDNFNDLTQDQYPLIITFWKFLMMLDGTLRSSFFEKFYSSWGHSMEQGVSKSRTLKALIQSKEVDFDKFSVSYWPHFNEKLTKNMDASTVFTQIISHIKGEFGCMEGAIRREQYVALSERRFSSLSSAVRERVYDIFLEYEKKKRAAREFDLSDFVNNLHKRLKTYGYSSYKFDFVYIDEVQDLTVSQIALLKYVSNNFREGFVFAGDTAQTIARGIDFRFEDIRSLFYKEFLSELKGKEKESRLSDMFQLCQNFRTHIGVLRLAQSVVDLLYYYFPFSVDKLNPETSLIYGDAPVLLESDGDENAITKIFGGRGCSSGRPTEFGAEQVILVRDDSAKKEILDIVGKKALVLTIIDCKGLEFQDVLLYNFFGSSPLENKWRVLYGYLENEDILDPSMTKSYPRFDITSHHLLCSELKQLYVAITRTKQRLWICENLKESCKPMFNYWKRLCLVQGTQLDTDFIDAMRTASTPDDWRVRGIKLFNECQFEMARMCFEKAGDVYNESWARAAGLFERAERQIFTNLEKAHATLQKAADIYETIRMYDKAATCYFKLGNYMKAGTIYLEKCGTSRLEDAGDCFSRTKCLQRAADVYFQANCFSKCTSVCLKAELFDEGLKYLEKWRLQEEKSTNKREFIGLEATRDDYLKNCADRFHLRGDYEKMVHFVRAMKSMEEIRRFLLAKKLHDELLTIELGAGNFIEAARIARIKEDLLLEARVWEKAGSFEKATRLVILAVIMESLWSYGSRGWRPKSFSKSEDYFTKAKDLAQKVSRCFHNSVCSELYLWDNKPKTYPKLLKLLVEAEKCKNTRLTFLSLRSLLDLHLNHETSGYLIEAEPHLDLKKWFHEMMVQGRVSLNSLIHIWVQWRDAATEVSSSLCEFCLDYLGVRRDDNDGTYCVLNSNAWWIGDKVKPLLKKSKSGGYFMTSHLYITSATSYWKSEIFSVGKAVVEKLGSLLRSYSNQAFCPETRGRVSLLGYEIIRSLKEIQSSEDKSNFLSYIGAVEAWFWDACFPRDPKNSVTQGVLSIIDCPAAVELLDELLDRLLGLAFENGEFTYGQLGKLSMILFLSGKLPDNKLDKIMHLSENRPKWQMFFDSLKGFFIDGSKRASMVVNFQKALQETYEVNWRKELDYMSPHYYLYLLEILTFFASSCLQSAGYMITTRSVLAEIMKLRGCKVFLDSPLDQMAPGALTPTCLLRLFEFIVHSVQELLCDRMVVLDWIKNCSSPLPRNFYHQMVLRLAIMLHMAYLNTSLDIYSAGKFLSSRGEISHILPVQFSSKLYQSRKSRDRHMSLVAFVDAFASVGDPLVVISQKEDHIVFPPSNFVYFCCDQMRDKDQIMSVLFPSSTGPDVTASMVNSTDIPSITVADEVPEATKGGQGIMDECLVKMLEAFQQCKKRDIAGTVDILGVLLSWLHQNKPPKSFYDQIFEDTRSVFDNFGNVTLPAKGNACLEALYSYWQDGEAKLKMIIDTLISKKMSKETLEMNSKDSALGQKEIVVQTFVAENEVKEKQSNITQKELFWNELEAFQQGTYQKEELVSIHNLLFAALSLLHEQKSLINFDGIIIEEMETVYSSFSDLLARGDALTLEDLYSSWPHGEIKLKLLIDTLLTSIERKSDDKEISKFVDKEASKSDDEAAGKPDDKEASESRPDEGKLVEEKVAAKTSVGSSSKHTKKKQKANNRKKKGGKKRR